MLPSGIELYIGLFSSFEGGLNIGKGKFSFVDSTLNSIVILHSILELSDSKSLIRNNI